MTSYTVHDCLYSDLTELHLCSVIEVSSYIHDCLSVMLTFGTFLVAISQGLIYYMSIIIFFRMDKDVYTRDIEGGLHTCIAM